MMRSSLNTDILRYKKNLVTIALIAGYVYLHAALTGLADFLPFSKWISFDVPLPFMQRLMIPFLIRGLQSAFPHALQIYEWFFCFEILFVGLLFGMLFLLLKQTLTHDQSLLCSWLFLLILPLVNIINYRYVMGSEAAFYTHYDIPALFFCVTGFYLCLTSRWLLFYLCVFLATFNRESAVLLVFLVPLMHAQKWKIVWKPALLALLFFLSAKLIVHVILKDQAGSWAEWIDAPHQISNFELNIHWLFYDYHAIFVLMFGFAGLPLAWFALYDFIPASLRPLRYLFAGYFIGLLFVGKYTEPRIFGELVVLMYYPVCLAVKNWLSGVVTQDKTDQQGYFEKILYYSNRYVIIGLLGLIVLCHVSIISFLDWILDL